LGVATQGSGLRPSPCALFRSSAARTEGFAPFGDGEDLGISGPQVALRSTRGKSNFAASRRQPASLRDAGEWGSGGTGGVAALNHRLPAGIPPGMRGSAHRVTLDQLLILASLRDAGERDPGAASHSGGASVAVLPRKGSFFESRGRGTGAESRTNGWGGSRTVTPQLGRPGGDGPGGKGVGGVKKLTVGPAKSRLTGKGVET